MRSAEGRGQTLDEAVDAALIQLGESRRNVDVKILSESADETHVEVTVIEPATAGATAAGDSAKAAGATAGAAATTGDTDAAKEIVGQLLARMGIRCSVTSHATPE